MSDTWSAILLPLGAGVVIGFLILLFVIRETLEELKCEVRRNEEELSEVVSRHYDDGLKRYGILEIRVREIEAKKPRVATRKTCAECGKDKVMASFLKDDYMCKTCRKGLDSVG